ncbi:hypothetical protein LX88_008402 [Lentzea californiensis]|nr:hypothetical protein [Lentzea californiensis]
MYPMDRLLAIPTDELVSHDGNDEHWDDLDRSVRELRYPYVSHVEFVLSSRRR